MSLGLRRSGTIAAAALVLALSFVVWRINHNPAVVRASTSPSLIGPTISPNREFPTLEYLGDVPLFPGRPGNSISALRNPAYVNASTASRWLKPGDFVVGIQIGAEVRAYPAKILNYHEIVNDQVGGRDLAVTYCPLAGSACAFSRKVGERLLSFVVADVVYESTLVMKDRTTGSLWHQLRGEALKGPLKGQKLVSIPSTICTWQAWRDQHSDSLVLSYLTGYTNNYASNYWSNPYAINTNIFSLPGYPVVHMDESHPPKEVVLGVILNGRTIAFPTRALQEREARIECDRRTFVARYDSVGKCPVAYWEEGDTRSAANGTVCFWFAWKAAFQDSAVWNGGTLRAAM